MTSAQACAVAVLVLAAIIPPAAPRAQSAGDGPKVIQSQDTNATGVVAELTECSRKEGVLSIKMRLRNTGKQPVGFDIMSSHSDYDKYYVTADNKKYFILRDSEKTPLTVQADSFGMLHVNLAPGQSFQWWAKYPAPPATVKTLSLYTPLMAPFDDIPIIGGD